MSLYCLENRSFSIRGAVAGIVGEIVSAPHYGTTILVYSLIAVVALPVLLLLHILAFFGHHTTIH